MNKRVEDGLRVTATRAREGIVLTICQSGAAPIRVELSHRRALLLGTDLIALAAEPLLTLNATPPADRGNEKCPRPGREAPGAGMSYGREAVSSNS